MKRRSWTVTHEKKYTAVILAIFGSIRSSCFCYIDLLLSSLLQSASHLYSVPFHITSCLTRVTKMLLPALVVPWLLLCYFCPSDFLIVHLYSYLVPWYIASVVAGNSITSHIFVHQREPKREFQQTHYQGYGSHYWAVFLTCQDQTMATAGTGKVVSCSASNWPLR